jgi:hypothetical protein
LHKVVEISTYGTVAEVISRGGELAGGKAVGNDGVGNVEGAVVLEAATSSCRIARDSGISDGEGGVVIDATAVCYCNIPR